MSISATKPACDVVIAGLNFTVRDLAEQDKASLIALHAQVFGEGAGAGEDWYRWKYQPGLAHTGAGSGVWHEGVLIAHCGGIARQLWQHGKPVSGIQIGDVMVAPQWRGILTRRGPFFHASQAFYAGHVAAVPGRIAYGFPSERHLRLAVTLKLLWDGGPVNALSWDLSGPQADLAGWQWRWKELDATDPRLDRAIDQAWAVMQRQAGGLTLGERDRAYVRWRYRERPGKQPRFFRLRRPWSPRAAGIAVLDLQTPDAQWLDWIGRTDRMPVAAAACKAQAARCAATRLNAWASPAVTQSLQNTQATSTVTAWLGIPRASHLAQSELADMHWWLMGGDTDFL